jgi:hypothetical protein
MKTKAEVDAELDRLERIIPELIAQYEPGEVLEAFAGEAEQLTELPPIGHEAYIRDRISCMLASAGLIPGETEGEPCGKDD